MLFPTRGSLRLTPGYRLTGPSGAQNRFILTTYATEGLTSSDPGLKKPG
jgi:hypothetical protein